jgi:hypothetical protein
VRRRLTRTSVLTLLAVTVIGGISCGIYQAGFDQGQIAAGSDLVDNQRAVGPFIDGGIAIVFKAVFAFLLIGFFAKMFAFRRFAHYGHQGDWNERREEVRSRMEERLTEWHEKAHGDAGEETPTTT